MYDNRSPLIAKSKIQVFCTDTLLKLQTLISVHIIGCRKTKLSMERKMFPVCGPDKYISALVGLCKVAM
jgi:hypothetical protein